MNCNTLQRLFWRISLLFALTLTDAVSQGLDETWTVTINGQTVQVNPDGTFRVRNVSAPDQFGPGGPGTAPDFVSDDFIRAVAISNQGGTTQYAFSDPFQFRNRQTFQVGALTFTDTPPPFPELLSITAPTTVLNQIGQTTQLTVTGELVDGSPVDLTQRSDWTVYRTSNPAVATVGENGLVTAQGEGTVFITAVNEGATGVKRLRVLPGDPLTTLEGFVQLEDGTPVDSAAVSILGLDFEATTDANGFYSMSGVPSALSQPLTVRGAAVIGGQSFVGSKQTEDPMPGGITDGGIITLVTTGGGLGPVLLSGMDPEDHFPAGGEMIRDFFLFVVGESAISANPSKIAMLGSATRHANTARGLAQSVGYTLDHITGDAILDVDFFDYDAIYMGSDEHDISGGLSHEDLDFINQRGSELVNFVNSGGGLAVFTQTTEGAYGWLKTIEPIQITENVGGSIAVTTAGEFFLSPSAVNVRPFHSGFLGPEGFFGLEVLATESSGNMTPLIVGGLASIPPDCNGNGILDTVDIANGTSQDCNGNGIPDECETDCNANGVLDFCDIRDGVSADVVGDGAVADGIPDECQNDANGNLVPDEIDIANGTSEDCNNNGVPDESDLALGTSLDCNANGIPDECEQDCNFNGVPDDCDLANGSSLDCNANGVPDECDIANGTSEDCNGNGVPDECDLAAGSSDDLIGSGAVSDGIPDECQNDTNGNLVPDEIDIADGTSEDCNTNGVPDESDIASGTSLDCNGNGIPDECEPDCNGNGIPDDCDIADGFSADCNGNGVPDECDVIQVYEIRLADLVGMNNACGGGSYYTVSSQGGFTWADLGATPASQVTVELNEAVQCHSTGTGLGTSLNGIADNTFATGPSFCSCGFTPGNKITVDLDPSSYVTGGLNEFLVTGLFDAWGLIPRTAEWGNEIYARVIVNYGGDCNNNGVLDECDIADGTSIDIIGDGAVSDGIPDECQNDANGNLIPDELDIADGTSQDCNGNGVPDEVDIANGASADVIGAGALADGIPDECQTDTNGDNVPD